LRVATGGNLQALQNFGHGGFQTTGNDLERIQTHLPFALFNVGDVTATQVKTETLLRKIARTPALEEDERKAGPIPGRIPRRKMPKQNSG
jgi:hypothetical protein